MTQIPRPGDRVQLTLVGTVESVDRTRDRITIQPHHLDADQFAVMSLSNNLPILTYPSLDAKEAQPGDRLTDGDGDVATVIFNDVSGEQLLIAYDDPRYGRRLRAYARINEGEEPITRPARDYGYATQSFSFAEQQAEEALPYPDLVPTPASPTLGGIEASFLAEAKRLGLDDTAAADAWNHPGAKPYAQLVNETQQRAKEAAYEAEHRAQEEQHGRDMGDALAYTLTGLDGRPMVISIGDILAGLRARG